MKVFGLIFICFSSVYGFSQNTKTVSDSIDKKKEIYLVEVACGECMFKMKGNSGDLALKLGSGKTYFIDGTSIDEHGDAHAKDGFCNAIRKAEVQGEIKDERFKVSYFKLL